MDHNPRIKQISPVVVSCRVFPAGCGPDLDVVKRVVISLSLLSLGILDVPPVIENNRNEET